jgi:hypothetical protein
LPCHERPERTAAEDTPLDIGSHADGSEHYGAKNGTAVAELFVPGVEDQVGHFTEWLVPPGGSVLNEFGGGSADLS